MNQLGVAKFLSEAKIGDKIYMSTKEHNYYGSIKSIHRTFVEIEDGNLSWYVDYHECFSWSLN